MLDKTGIDYGLFPLLNFPGAAMLDFMTYGCSIVFFLTQKNFCLVTIAATYDVTKSDIAARGKFKSKNSANDIEFLVH